jgi:hypothetical protein
MGDGEAELPILFGTDPDLDQVLRYRDFDDNGDYNGPSETVPIYLDTLGTVPLTSPDCIVASPDDSLYVGDSGEHIILWANDADEDGNAAEPGEHGIYFDARPGGNSSAIVVDRFNGIDVRLLGTTWAATSGTAVGGDSILRLADVNADGDANDSGEAQIYLNIPSASPSDSIPSAVKVGEEGDLYFVENGTTGAFAKGVYHTVDLDSNGSIHFATEVFPFFVPPALANAADLTGLDRDEEVWFLVDRANRVVWRFADSNQNGSIQVPGEAAIHWSLGPTPDLWDLAIAEGEFVFLGNSIVPDRLHMGADFDASSLVEPGEVFDVYTDFLAAHQVDHPKALTPDFHSHEEVGNPYCFGVRTCPCGNNRGPTSGCQNSTGLGGFLEGHGTSGITNDDLELHAEFLPPLVVAVLFQGQGAANGGAGTPFGDGLLCVTPPIKRLGVVTTTAAGMATWGPGLASTGGWAAGQTRYFQVWYRDSTGPCGTGVNMTNGLEITFTR